MTRTPKLLLISSIFFATATIAPSPAPAQPGYGGPPPTITCSSNDGRRNWCDIGGHHHARLVRQISGSACIRDSTWGIDGRGLWVDRGCRAEFIVGGRPPGPPPPPPPPPPRQVVTCSSNDGRRNWCDIGPSRDVRLVRQISGSACIRDNTWGVDRRGLWVDRGCRADFRVR
jgi:Protein of unknown function (DUF3011)